MTLEERVLQLEGMVSDLLYLMMGHYSLKNTAPDWNAYRKQDFDQSQCMVNMINKFQWEGQIKIETGEEPDELIRGNGSQDNEA
jgi:hypothetical protein